MQQAVYKPVTYRALTQIYAGTSLDITADKSGSYLVPLAKFTDKLPHDKANDEELQEKVCISKPTNVSQALIQAGVSSHKGKKPNSHKHEKLGSFF